MLPQQTEELLNGFVGKSKEILKDNLTGVYLHGSSVMGCFNPQKSDIDLIIVADRPLSDPVKREFMDMVAGYSAQGPAKGIEMSVVLREVCRPFVYPTPFELHFSEGHREWFEEDPDGYIREMNGTDKDLAAHFTVINKRGRCLYGAPVEDVFGEVPDSDYMDSLWYDIEGAADEIAEYTLYLTLNLARVLAYKEKGLVLSKKEGGEWALGHIPAEYHPLIEDAVREYTENEETVYDKALAGRYAGYVLKRIRSGKLEETVMTREERAEKAVQLLNSGGCNCAQAVTGALADQTGLTEEQLKQAAAGFGAGMGNMEGVCGALIGAGIIAGLKTGGLGTVKKTRCIQEEFRSRCGAIKCRDLKTMTDGKPLCPCADCVRNAVVICGEVLDID